MPLKYMLGMPKPNYFVGMAHGVLFIAYVVLLALVVIQYKWSLKKAVLAFLASFVPFGTFYADKKLFREKIFSDKKVVFSSIFVEFSSETV